MGTMGIERNLYDGVFYCKDCGRPIHCFFVLIKDQSCVCGSKGFISYIDYRIPKLMECVKIMIEEEGIKIS